jgi:hemolysin III
VAGHHEPHHLIVAVTSPEVALSDPPKPRHRGRIHQFASFVSIPAAIVLFVVSPGPKAHVATAIYGLTLVNMFSTSAIYHRRTWTERGRRRIQALDHSAIYLLIAGSYTPLSLLVLNGWIRIAMLATVWTCAAVMIGLKHAFPGRFVGLAGVMYIALGWVAVAASPSFFRAMTGPAIALIIVGGVLYTMGAIVLNRHWPDPNPLVFGYHEVWHVFMTSAATCHYTAILLTVLAFR